MPGVTTRRWENDNTTIGISDGLSLYNFNTSFTNCRFMIVANTARPVYACFFGFHSHNLNSSPTWNLRSSHRRISLRLRLARMSSKYSGRIFKSCRRGMAVILRVALLRVKLYALAGSSLVSMASSVASAIRSTACVMGIFK